MSLLLGETEAVLLAGAEAVLLAGAEADRVGKRNPLIREAKEFSSVVDMSSSCLYQSRRRGQCRA